MRISIRRRTVEVILIVFVAWAAARVTKLIDWEYNRCDRIQLNGRDGVFYYWLWAHKSASHGICATMYEGRQADGTRNGIWETEIPLRRSTDRRVCVRFTRRGGRMGRVSLLDAIEELESRDDGAHPMIPTTPTHIIGKSLGYLAILLIIPILIFAWVIAALCAAAVAGARWVRNGEGGGY